jgi:hypothetical protein
LTIAITIDASTQMTITTCIQIQKAGTTPDPSHAPFTTPPSAGL